MSYLSFKHSFTAGSLVRCHSFRKWRLVVISSRMSGERGSFDSSWLTVYEFLSIAVCVMVVSVKISLLMYVMFF